MQTFILEKHENKILNKRNFILLILLFSCTFLGFSQTTGGGILAPLVTFLNDIYNSIIVVVGIGAAVVIALAIFRHVADPNMAQLILVVIGSILVVVLVYKAKDMITMAGGSTLELEVIKNLYF